MRRFAMNLDGRGPTASRRGGFTLIEIMIALAVIGTAVGFMIVEMGGLTQHERLRAAARKLAGISDFVRSHATGSQRSCYLELDLDLQRFRYRQDPLLDSYGRPIDADDGHFLDDEEVKELEESFEWEDLPRGVYFKAVWISAKLHYLKEKVRIEYLPSGRLQTTVVQLENRATEDDSDRREAYSVIINGLSGKAEVVDWLARFPEAEESDFTAVMGRDAPGGGGEGR